MLTLVAGLAMVLDQTFYIESLKLDSIRQGWGAPQAGKSVDGAPLKINGKTYAHGLGTHAESVFLINVDGKAKAFHAEVGVDDECDGKPASVEFKVRVDGEIVWTSGVMKPQDAAKVVDVALKGARRIALIVSDGGDGMDYDHADWADATITMTSGAPIAVETPKEKPYILTPKPSAKPKLTGAKTFGARPGSEFLFTLTATGAKPITFSAKGLPAGLSLDPKTGIVTGRVQRAGTYTVEVAATNAKGVAKRDWKVVIGSKISLTPPMGWNHWNCWGIDIDQQKALSSARAMALNLKDHGWTYVNIDDGWQGLRGGPFNAIMPNKKFPDYKAMCDEIHAMGLKVGIYSTPWKRSYGSHIGGSSDHADGSYDVAGMNENNKWIRGGEKNEIGKFNFIDRDVKQWSAWGIDYLKYDWHVWTPEVVQAMRDELDKSNRDIVYSLSNSAPFPLAQEWANRSNCWRTTGDIYDAWVSLYNIWQTQDRWGPYAGPGHWNDPDMLIVGKLGWGPSLHPTRLTPSEQYTHITLWSMLSAPLLLGCDLAQLDDFTLNLLTNDEVIAIDQDPLGKQARLKLKEGDWEVWVKELEGGDFAVSVFNAGEDEGKFSFAWDKVGLKGPFKVRDLWRQKDLTSPMNGFSTTVPRHGVTLVKIWRP